MITHRKKQYHKAMEPPEKNIFMEKKQFRDMKSKQEIQKENPKNTKQWILYIQYL